MKVAVVNTGPEVNCPMAMAYRSCCSVGTSSPRTRSLWRKARSTEPDPQRKAVRRRAGAVLVLLYAVFVVGGYHVSQTEALALYR